MFKILSFVAAVVVVNAAFIYFGGAAWLSQSVTPTETSVWSTDPVLVDVFIFTLQEEVRKKVGQPIEGYEPQMFLDVFPGLTETDFDGVEASVGFYHIEQGRLTFVVDESQLVHSAAEAVTRRGVETLLHNVATRTNINLNTDGTITDIMSVLIRS